ncbi:MAG TPA: Ig-like domain-containing protein [Bacteroidia bacterium]|nr:Ig-like domain-containing protein [Bacteroidia bacterium]
MKGQRHICKLFSAVAGLLLVCSCANRIIPGGGPVDERAPGLTTESPPNGSVNFSAKEIVITFDEYVQVKDASHSLVVSPPMEPLPKVMARKRSIIITLPDSLRAATTYTLDFGDAIADINESNPIRGYRYVFATGEVLDTLTIGGVVVQGLTMKPVPGALAAAFPADLADSLLGKTAPDYFARCGDNGTFLISNMRPGLYRIFGLNDKNNNLRADIPDEELAFVTDPVEPGTSGLQLRLSRQEPLAERVLTSELTEPGRLVTGFARGSSALSWKFLQPVPDKVVAFQNSAADSLVLLFMPRADSVEVAFSERGIAFDTVSERLRRGSNQQLSTTTYMRWIPAPPAGGTLDAGVIPSITWEVPLTGFDTSKVTFFRDTIPLTGVTVTTDSSGRTTQFAGTWTEGRYSITLAPGAATDMFGRANDTIRQTFSVPGERTRGSIRMQLSQEEGVRIMQLVTEKDEVVKQWTVPHNGKVELERIEPGIYRLRLIADSNKNGRWDAGNYRTGVQPEQVTYYPEAITVRANWELELEWN